MKRTQLRRHTEMPRSRKPEERRACVKCGRDFVWRYGLSAANWAKQRCCSHECKVAAIREGLIPSNGGNRTNRRGHGAARRPVTERFWKNVRKSDACWEWTANRSTAGYGHIKKGGRQGEQLGAHRVSWELHNGPIPPGLFVCHHCDNPRCVRPDHLFLGTTTDNVRDAICKGRMAWQMKALPQDGNVT
jgi:hypothetical protein